eukprot:TRINITY_DN11163_c0_g1_i1.p1 TRINITY_DN11163_c0_g1~~TRINITY_DN11163_c0_g1_i1.p1  ORF type:complete len:355 (+),score=105.36 TRINITY_DN11163_c0_g1_i1:85-1149(+)
MCIRDRYQRRVRGKTEQEMGYLDSLRNKSEQKRGAPPMPRSQYDQAAASQYGAPPSASHHLQMLEETDQRRAMEAMAQSRMQSAAFNQSVDFESCAINDMMSERVRVASERDAIESRIQGEVERRMANRLEINHVHPMLAQPPVGPVEPVAYSSGSYMDSLLRSARSQRPGYQASPSSLVHNAVPGDGSVASLRMSSPGPEEEEDPLALSMDEIKAKIEMLKEERSKMQEQPEGSEAEPAVDAPQHTEQLAHVQHSPQPMRSPVRMVPDSTPERMPSDRSERLRQLQDRVLSIPPSSSQASSLCSATQEQLSVLTKSALSVEEISALTAAPRSSNIMHLRAQLDALREEPGEIA